MIMGILVESVESQVFGFGLVTQTVIHVEIPKKTNIHSLVPPLFLATICVAEN
jgi:hypothetical protein